MGEMADRDACRAGWRGEFLGIENEFEESIAREIRNKKWETADGEKIKVKNMDKEHIENCIKMFKRRIDRAEKLIQMFEFELDYRDESDEVGFEELDNDDDIPY